MSDLCHDCGEVGIDVRYSSIRCEVCHRQYIGTHVCGLQGFGTLGDTCEACVSRDAQMREARDKCEMLAAPVREPDAVYRMMWDSAEPCVKGSYGQCMCDTCVAERKAARIADTITQITHESMQHHISAPELPLCAMCREPLTPTVHILLERPVCDKCVSAFGHLTLRDVIVFCQRVCASSSKGTP